MSLAPNILAFTALANEYCSAVEHCPALADRDGFVRDMLRLLPRIYISATDLEDSALPDYDAGLASALEEPAYDLVRDSVSRLMGENDIFLEVFEEDMKYSDTPIAASISECLADIYQALYNYLETVREAPEEVVLAAAGAEKEEFASYWSSTLCNVLRALNRLAYDN